VHELRDRLADAARRLVVHGRQLGVGAAHRVERDARDAAAAAKWARAHHAVTVRFEPRQDHVAGA
jgi:hypothetical protein